MDNDLKPIQLDPVEEREKTMRETRSVLESKIDEALTAEAMQRVTGKVKDALNELAADFEETIKQWTPYNLAAWVQDMAERAIKAMLEGDDETMRQYLQCRENQYTGRDREHPVIRGRLFETGAVELRHKIVDAHAELLKTERIKDLEDQLASVVKQVRDAEARMEAQFRNRESTEF